MGAQLTSIIDKTNSQQFRISQRLQWAAGANPALNSIVDEFERCMKRRKQILQVINRDSCWRRREKWVVPISVLLRLNGPPTPSLLI